MSNQLQITGGAKVRNLEGVITGTTGVLNSLPINGSNGIPQLDVNGKILVSQLPNSVMEYLGTWNAATNTPTLVNGTGNAGDVYLCSVAGTVNFGAGPISFVVSDQVIYSGTIWQKASGTNGTVTSVAVTESGDALSITGSPITTSGTINIGFAGTSAQYVAGDGSLITFPSIVSEAQNLITEVYNETGATLAKGTVVYINGGHGNLPTVTKAQADSEINSAQTYGLVRADISNNNNGYVTVAGRLSDLDTQAFAGGTTLYLSPSVAGGYTSTKPTSPDHIVYIGVVVRSHPTQGVIEVNIQNTQELKESSDVLITSPTNNQGLFYDSATSLWKNNTIATALGYTPQPQLNGTGFVKATGTTISYDNSTYLTTSAAASTYVPYVGATANVYLGDNSISSSNHYINGIAGTLGGMLAIKQFNSSSSGATGYTSINAYGSTNLFFSYSISSGINRRFSFAVNNISNNAEWYYEMPNASGTLALTSNLSSYVPYNGATADVDLGAYNIKANSFNIPSAGSTNQLTSFANTSNLFSGSAGLNVFGFNVSNNIYFGKGATNGGVILWNNTQVRYYTLPDADGTIALTSNLTSYLPLTGGTLTGALNGTSATFSGNLEVFSGSAGVTVGDFLVNPTTKYVYVGRQSSTSGDNTTFVVRDRTGSARATIPGGGSIDTVFSTNNSNFIVSNYSGNSLMTIANTGAATFSSSVTAATNFIAQSSTTNSLRFLYENTYNKGGVSIDYTTGEFKMYAGESGNGYFQTFYTQGSERMRITSGGNVGIGTSSPNIGGGASGSTILTVSATTSGRNGVLELNGTRSGSGDYTGYVRFYNNAAATPLADIFAIRSSSDTTGDLGFATSNIERMRITSGGGVESRNMNTSVAGFAAISPNSYTSAGFVHQSLTSAGTGWYHFIGQSGNGSTITTNNILIFGNGNVQNTNNSYGAFSDIKLKENILDSTPKLNDLLKVKIRNYNLIGDETKQIGVIAQELEEIFPSMIDETEDFEDIEVIDEDGNIRKERKSLGTVTKSVKYSVFVPMLIKAIQELKAEIDELKNK